MSNHKLSIETGRHHTPKIPVTDRTYPKCNVKEDEIHFSTECDLYKDNRKSLYTTAMTIIPCFTQLNNRDKFINIINNNNIRLSNITLPTLKKAIM